MRRSPAELPPDEPELPLDESELTLDGSEDAADVLHGEDPARASALAALAHGQFRLLFAGLVFSNVGKWMQEFGLGWLVAEQAVREGNPALAGVYLGMRSIASAVPSLLSSMFAGVYADRMDRRVLLLASRMASAVVAVALAIVVLFDQLSFPVLILLSAAAWATFAFDPPVRQAMLPRIVPREHLFSAIGLMRAGLQSARAIGPLVAGVILVSFSMGGVMLVNAAFVLASVVVLLPMRPQPPGRHAKAGTPLRSLLDGVAYVVRDDLIRWCAILQIAFALFAAAFVQLMPALAVQTLHVGAVELSILTGAVGAGSLLGAVLITRLAGIRRRGVLLAGALGALGVLLAVLGLQTSMAGAVGVLFVLGILQQVFMGVVSIILQLAAPDHLRGRIMSIQSTIFLTGMPVGVFVLGTLGSLVGVSNSILIGGIVTVAIAGLALARASAIRDLRSIEGRAPGGTTRGAPATAAGGSSSNPGAAGT